MVCSLRVPAFPKETSVLHYSYTDHDFGLSMPIQYFSGVLRFDITTATMVVLHTATILHFLQSNKVSTTKLVSLLVFSIGTFRFE